ncbi:MAG: ABC transporter ATP-binding protein, partial [Brachybacterium sp.]
MQTVPPPTVAPPTVAPAAASPAAPAPSDPVIVVEDLSFRYPGTDRDTLRNVDLTIQRGDFVAVVGGNGSAKTTLCKTFNGLVPHYWNGDFAGSVHVDGTDTWDSSVAELSSRVGYVYQDFQNQLVRPTVRDEVSFGPLNFGHQDYRERTEEALAQLGITHLRDSFVWQLSGGQAHLVALAAVLAMRPEVIVVDEPVAELDPARAREIYLRLRELNQRHGITVIAIEHHAEFIAEFARSVVLMADGAPVWHLPVQEAMDRHRDLEAHGIPAPDVVALTAAAGEESVALDVHSAVTMLRPHVGERPTAAGDAVELPDALAGSVASLRGIHHGYRTVAGDLAPVLVDLELDLRAGERIALVGTNGAGKTTLMKLLTGLIVPRQGTVTVDGIDTRSRSAARLSDHVAYLYQHPQQMFLKDTVRADVALFPTGRKVPDAQQRIDEVIRRVGLDELASRDGRTLSGGQQRRATIAIGLAMRPALLLLDEPTSSLDVRSRHDVTGMLDSLAETVRCAVVATHDMELVASWASRVIVL